MICEKCLHNEVCIDYDSVETCCAEDKGEALTYCNNFIGWIPVSEKLPDWDIECLVVDKDGNYGVGFYRDDAKAWDSPNWGWLEIKDRVDNKEAFTQPCGIGKVIAWMPLPKSYSERYHKYCDDCVHLNCADHTCGNCDDRHSKYEKKMQEE